MLRQDPWHLGVLCIGAVERGVPLRACQDAIVGRGLTIESTICRKAGFEVV